MQLKLTFGESPLGGQHFQKINIEIRRIVEVEETITKAIEKDS